MFPEGTATVLLSTSLGRLADLAGPYASRQLAPAEIVRQIVRNVMDHRSVQLRDDATMLLVQWHREPE
jgi:hypothetical protein